MTIPHDPNEKQATLEALFQCKEKLTLRDDKQAFFDRQLINLAFSVEAKVKQMELSPQSIASSRLANAAKLESISDLCLLNAKALLQSAEFADNPHLTSICRTLLIQGERLSNSADKIYKSYCEEPKVQTKRAMNNPYLPNRHINGDDDVQYTS